MSIDWNDSSRADRLAFEQIDPNDLEASRGWLDGAVRRGSSVTYSYYSDTRAGGQLEIADANYIESSLIRIHHFVDAWGYRAELGTFFVTGSDLSFRHGAYFGTLDLKSRLAAMDDDRWTRHYSIAEGRYAKAALAAIFDEEGLAYRIAPSVRDYRYAAANVYGFGERVLTTAMEVCDKAGARLGVDGHGTVTVDPYVPPSERAPVWEYGPSNVVGPVKVTTSALSMPGRVGVVHKTSEDAEITAYADVPATSPAARSRRGRRVTEIVDVADMSPATFERAGQIARERLANATSEGAEYEFDALYSPRREGDAVELLLGGERLKCMVKTLDVSLAPGLPTRVTLKGV